MKGIVISIAVLLLVLIGLGVGFALDDERDVLPLPADLTLRAKACFTNGYFGMLVEVQHVQYEKRGGQLYWSMTTSCIGRRAVAMPEQPYRVPQVPSHPRTQGI